MLNKSEFLTIIIGMCEVFSKKPSEYIVDLYYEIFKNYSTDEVKKAFTLCVKSHKYNTLPKPAEILAFLEESKEDKMLKAWMQVNEAIRKGGFYRSIEFKDKVIHHCIVELGGWPWLCSQDKSNMPFIEKRFYSIYSLFEKRAPQDYPKLIGFIEAKNIGKGYNDDIPETLRIGFEEELPALEVKQ